MKTEAQFSRKRVVRNVFCDKLKLNVSVCRAFGFHRPYFFVIDLKMYVDSLNLG